MIAARTFGGLNTLFNKTHHDVVNARIVFGTGAYNEASPEIFGVAHFLEHMFFKGTKHNDYKRINQLTSLYGNINAYTSRYVTVYHFTFLRENFRKAMDVLMEMVFEPLFPADELEKEKGVIVQEFKTYQDEPNHYFYDKMLSELCGSAHGHPIIGTQKTIEEMTVDQVRQFHETFYFNPNNFLLSVTGNVEDDEFVNYCQGKAIEYKLADRQVPTTTTIDYDGEHSFTHKSEQAIISLVFPGKSSKERLEANYAYEVLFNAVGSGMHSLLFDRIREELGLCYSVGAAHWAMQNTGMGYVHVRLDEKQIPLAVEEINAVLDKVMKEGISEELMSVSKSNILFKTIHGMEYSEGINRLADSYFMLHDKWIGASEILENVSSVDYVRQKVYGLTNDDIIKAAQIFNNKRKLVKMTCER